MTNARKTPPPVEVKPYPSIFPIMPKCARKLEEEPVF
jgi:hypothetical protein